MSPLYISLAFLAGVILPIQIGINASLSRQISSPISATTISVIVGAVALIAYLIVSHFSFSKANWPAMSTMRALPLWTLSGGVLGALYVSLTIVCAPQIGSTLLVVLVITGQMIISLLIDHYGLVGFPVRAINIWRVLGVGFLLTGVIMIMRH